MNKRKIFGKGFTLVELLIVIALIAILSVAVLATINPIEQSNKARDAAMKNDAAEVLAAYERYYASQNYYPWNVGGTDSTLVIGSTQTTFGVGQSALPGALIDTSELKSSFMGKKPFQSDAKDEDMLVAYHNATTNSNYVCYFPKATANRTGTKASDLKCIGTNVILNVGAGCTNPAPGATWTYVPSETVANASCVPEGDIQ